MENYIEKKLGELLSHPNQIIRNNAMSILKQLQREYSKKQENQKELMIKEIKK